MLCVFGFDSLAFPGVRNMRKFTRAIFSDHSVDLNGIKDYDRGHIPREMIHRRLITASIVEKGGMLQRKHEHALRQNQP